MTFEEFNLKPELLRAVEELGYTETAPIQEAAIPLVLEGLDIIGQAQTGTGKTAAFALPILQRLDPDNRALQAMVLCPTRELAIQVAGEFRKLAAFTHGVRILPIYGGEDMSRQIKSLKGGVQVIIGTPGRIMDHMRRRTLKVNTLRTIVLDEADEMLNMGFREDIETILQDMPDDRQTLLFSATMPRPILEITEKYQTDARKVQIKAKALTVDNIAQSYFEVRPKHKNELLMRLLDMYMPHLAIIFCNTRHMVDELAGSLKTRGYFAEGLHGELTQAQRDRVMAAFRAGLTNILVATDVAARGIDVAGVDIVFNYDLPQDPEYYVHRIGRTGRAGKSGLAFSFVFGREVAQLRDTLRICHASAQKQNIPSRYDVSKMQLQNLFLDTSLAIAAGGLSGYRQVIQDHLSKTGMDPVDFAAALLKQFPNIREPEIESVHDEPDELLNSYRHEKGMTRLFISIGRRDRIRPNDIVGAIAGETGVPGKLIGHIDIHDKCTFVDVPDQHAKRIVRAMSKVKIRGKSLRIEKAQG